MHICYCNIDWAAVITDMDCFTLDEIKQALTNIADKLELIKIENRNE